MLTDFKLTRHPVSCHAVHCAGPITDVGTGAGTGFTINVPLPPGSGSGAYRAAFDRVVAPALDAFQPELILVSSGFDASFRDPLSAQMCGSHDYR
jgi:acetoin utilization deacetylase AcuC-like enzyme